jgi:heat shock protein HslJ
MSARIFRALGGRAPAVLVSALVLAACAGPQAPAPVSPFAGTAWELHAIQSMDDAQGTTRIADPKRFTVRFEADGRASLRLDCNRGTADWKATPAADRVSGQLQFGPIAGTRALCPPPHLDERVVRDLSYVRGYLLRDGKLFMSLMADGGILEWHPHRE